MARTKKAPGYFVRRGKGWRWKVCVAGKYHVELILVDERRDAEDYARKRYDELAVQRGREAIGLPVGLRVGDLLTYFERERLPLLSPGTMDAYKDSLRPIRTYFVDHLGNPRLDRVRPVHIADYLDWRRVHRLDGKHPLHNRTLAKDRAVLHAAFAVACEREWCPGNPVRKGSMVPKGDSRAPVILTDAEYENVLRAAPDALRRFYLLLLGETGCRDESEALWIRWEDFDLTGGFLEIVTGRNAHRTKTGHSRHCPLTPRLHAAARAFFAAYRFAEYDGTRPEFVFHHTHTHAPHYRAGERVKSYRAALDTASEDAKLPEGWHLHDLRHRRVTTWLAEGKSPVLVQKALGHADLRTTMGYYRYLKDHLRALVEVAPAGHILGIAGA